MAGVDLCRVHVSPCGHPVHADVTTIDAKGQHEKRPRFYARQGNGSREITDGVEIQRYIAQRRRSHSG